MGKESIEINLAYGKNVNPVKKRTCLLIV